MMRGAPHLNAGKNERSDAQDREKRRDHARDENEASLYQGVDGEFHAASPWVSVAPLEILPQFSAGCTPSFGGLMKRLLLTVLLAVSLPAFAQQTILKNTSNLFDAVTGKYVGVIDGNGREQHVVSYDAVTGLNVGGTPVSGGGVSTFGALTDAATANIPVTNAPTASALALKAPLPNVLSAANSALQKVFEAALISGGVQCNGTHDDLAGAQAALNLIASTASNNNGATGNGIRLYLPECTLGLSGQLQIPTRIRLIGHGKRGPTGIIALSTFSQGAHTDASLVKLGLDSDSLAFDCGLEDIYVDGKGFAAIGVSANKLQEGSGILRTLVSGWTVKGLYFPNDNDANFFLDEMELYSSGSSATAAIELNHTGGKVMISNVTIVGVTTAASLTYGIYLNTGNADIRGVHIESLGTGVRFVGNSSSGAIRTITGPIGATVTTVVSADQWTTAFAEDILQGAATNTIVDAAGTFITTQVPYIGRYGAYTYTAGDILVPLGVGGPTVSINMTFGSFNVVNTLTAATTIGAPTNGLKGQMLYVYMVEDGTGSRTATFNSVFHGVTLASSGAANTRSLTGFLNVDGTIWMQMFTSGWVN